MRSCSAPLVGYQSTTPSETGTFPVHLGNPPRSIAKKLTLPCGKCAQCQMSNRFAWAVRAYHEYQTQRQACMVTLTYSDPCPDELVPEHMTLFWKRFRKASGIQGIKYLYCGEYGDKTHRPHYHALIFGTDLRNGARFWDGKNFLSPLLEKTWDQGRALVSPFSMATACYVAGYVDKKADDPDTFRRMSRKPGLGHQWLEDNLDNLRRLGSVIVEGRRFPIPHRYLDWVAEINPDAAAKLKAARQQYVDEYERAHLYDPTAGDRRRAREINATSRRDNRKRSI